MQIRIFLVVVTFWYSCAIAQESTEFNTPSSGVQEEFSHYRNGRVVDRPKVVLALSGGGTRGFAHIGVIKALLEEGIPIDGIAGTSIGAIIGGLYASGYSAEELEKLAKSIDWSDIFRDTPPRRSLPLSSKIRQSVAILEVRFNGVLPYIPSGLTAGQKLASLLTDRVNRAVYRGEPNYDHLKIPFIAVSTDLRDGKRILFREGDLAEALFASIALPLLISPVQMDGQVLIDGGVTENIPVSAAKELGDFIIAVDATMPPVLGMPPYEPWEVANQVTGLLQQENNRKQRDAAEVVIKPLPDSLTNLSLAKPGNLIRLGYRAAKEQIPLIKERLAGFSAALDTCLVRVTAVEFNCPSDTMDLRSISKALFFLAERISLVESDIIDDLEAFRSIEGIFDAQAIILGDTLQYYVMIDPVVEAIALEGVTQLDITWLKNILRGSVPETKLRFSDVSVEKILSAYRDLGNSLAKIATIQMEPDGVLKISIDEGVIREVRTEGTRNIHPSRILRDVDIKVGKPLNIEALNVGIEELYGSNLFEIIRATIVNDTVTIKVQEHRSPRLRLGAGMDSDRHGRGFAEISHESVPFLGGSTDLWLKYGEFDERYELTYRNLAVLTTYVEGAISLFSTRTQYKDYDDFGESQGGYHFREKGGTVHLGQQFRTWGRLTFGLSAYRLRSVFGEVAEEMDLRKLFVRSQFDTQDRTNFPTTGTVYDFQLESGMKTLGGDESYNRVQIEISKAVPISRRITLTGKLRGGICDQSTPFPEWLRLGGEQSLFGLYQDEIAGRQIANFSVGLREDLISRFLAEAYLSIRWDLGAIWEDLESDVKTDNIKQGLGISFELDTFLGPMSLSYGYLFKYKEHPARDRIYFNLGHRF